MRIKVYGGERSLQQGAVHILRDGELHHAHVACSHCVLVEHQNQIAVGVPVKALLRVNSGEFVRQIAQGLRPAAICSSICRRTSADRTET